MLRELRAAGHIVYDFREDKQVDSDWRGASPTRFTKTLMTNPAAVHQFNVDFSALNDADTLVLVTPCGRSSHLEAGFAKGKGKDVYALLLPGFEPELMYGMVDYMLTSLVDLRDALSRP